jgi:hypothetical protein
MTIGSSPAAAAVATAAAAAAASTRCTARHADAVSANGAWRATRSSRHAMPRRANSSRPPPSMSRRPPSLASWRWPIANGTSIRHTGMRQG